MFDCISWDWNDGNKQKTATGFEKKIRGDIAPCGTADWLLPSNVFVKTHIHDILLFSFFDFYDSLMSHMFTVNL